jgi:predicted RNA-binding Zn ribbon-like protein
MMKSEGTYDSETVRLPGSDLPFRWLGGSLCLDYSNTVAWLSGSRGREVGRPRLEYERLTRYERLAQWAQAARIVSEPEEEAFLTAARAEPRAAESALQSAKDLREAIHRLFVILARTGTVDLPSLDPLNAVLQRALPHRSLAGTGDRLTWTWELPRDDPESLLWPVALDAAGLLTSEDVSRVRQCSGDDCGFLFLDRGRGPGRRWCNMAHCGNRAKVRRYYRRRRDGPSRR